MDPQAFNTTYTWHNNAPRNGNLHTEDIADVFSILPRPSRPPYHAYARSPFQHSQPMNYKETFHNANIPVQSLVF